MCCMISFVIKSNLKSSIIYPTYLVISCHTKERPTQYLIQIDSPLLLLEPETFFVTCVTFPKWNINLSNNLHGSFHITSINPLRKMLNATVAKIVIRLWNIYNHSWSLPLINCRFILHFLIQQNHASWQNGLHNTDGIYWAWKNRMLDWFFIRINQII